MGRSYPTVDSGLYLWGIDTCTGAGQYPELRMEWGPPKEVALDSPWD